MYTKTLTINTVRRRNPVRTPHSENELDFQYRTRFNSVWHLPEFEMIRFKRIELNFGQPEENGFRFRNGSNFGSAGGQSVSSASSTRYGGGGVSLTDGGTLFDPELKRSCYRTLFWAVFFLIFRLKCKSRLI